MKYERFKQLWDALITDSPKKPIDDKTIIMDGCSEHTTDSLIKASHGDFSDFDKIDKILEEKDKLQ